MRPSTITKLIETSVLNTSKNKIENMVYNIYINKSKLYSSTFSVALPQKIKIPTDIIIIYAIILPKTMYSIVPIIKLIS